MQFSDIYNSVADQIGDTSTTNITRIKRYINWSQQDVCSRENWDFLMKQSYFQCTAPYTTGTAVATNGSTTITGTDTAWTSSMVGRKLKFDADSEYYTIASVESATSLTLNQAYLEDTISTAEEYSIYQDIYSLDSDVEKIVSMSCPTSNEKIVSISRQEMDYMDPSPFSSGIPNYYTEVGRDSSGYKQVQLYNVPDDSYVIYYWYRKQIADLSGDSDESVIPSKYHQLLYFGGCFQYYDYDQDESGTVYRAQYENMLENMRKDYISGPEDKITTLGSYGNSSVGPTIQLPPQHFKNK
jgi:hypothetical protein